MTKQNNIHIIQLTEKLNKRYLIENNNFLVLNKPIKFNKNSIKNIQIYLET